MSQTTTIEWCRDPYTGERGMTWNPIRGCSHVSPGCEHCYGERIAMRFCGFREAVTTEPGLIGTTKPLPFHGFADENGWTGRVEIIESKLEEPVKRRKPTLYFVNSMSDLFHEALSDDDIDRVYAVMALCPQHWFLVLTKRAKRMHDWYIPGFDNREHIVGRAMCEMTDGRDPGLPEFPLPNVWLGVTVEDQQRADERIPWLLRTPAALRFVSIEPMLGDVDLTCLRATDGDAEEVTDALRGEWGSSKTDYPSLGGYGETSLDWVICGGETGPGARPIHPDWARRVVQDCKAAGVPVFVKQVTERGRKIPFAEWPPDLQVQEMPNAV